MDTPRAIAKLLQDFAAELLEVFSRSVIESINSGNAGSLEEAASPMQAAPAEKPERPRRKVIPVAAAPRSARVPKTRRHVARSTQEEVDRLGDRIVTVLRRSSHDLAAREILSNLKLGANDEGRFHYALQRLKDEGLVEQHGERRGARYAAA